MKACNIFLIYTIATSAAILGTPATAATFTPINLSDIANLTLQGKNAAYPQGRFLSRFAVPFDIEVNGSGHNAWGSGDGIGGGSGNDGLWTATIDVGQGNVHAIYTLANTDWGRNGNQRFSITANFDNGKSLVWKYTDGSQLRDWNLFPAFATSINGTDTNEVFRVSSPLPVKDGNPDVLDMQTLAVPVEFHSSILESLVFSDLRQTFIHSAFVAGVTLSDIGAVTPALQPIPLPAAVWLFGTGLLALVGMGRRKKSK